MKKYAFLISQETKRVDILLNDNDIKAVEMAKREGFELKEVEQGVDGFWYLKGYAKKNKDKDDLLHTLQKLEKETGFTRIIRDMYFSLKNIGITINPIVDKKFLEIEKIAKQYREILNKENKNGN